MSDKYDPELYAVRQERDELKKRVRSYDRIFNVLGTLFGVLFVLWVVKLIPTATAMPLDSDGDTPALAVFSAPPDATFVGTFADESGELFQLYDARTAQNASTALASYESHLTETILARDWRDCQGLSNIQTACCHTAHGFGKLVSQVGVPAFAGFVTAKVNEATTGGRDNQKPRSICHTLDRQNVCISWANYIGSTLRNGESGDIGNFAAKCAAAGMSSEFKATTSDGGIIFICVSNRASGCDNTIG